MKAAFEECPCTLEPWSVIEGTCDKIKHLELNHVRDNVVNDRLVLPNQHGLNDEVQSYYSFEK